MIQALVRFALAGLFTLAAPAPGAPTAAPTIAPVAAPSPPPARVPFSRVLRGCEQPTTVNKSTPTAAPIFCVLRKQFVLILSFLSLEK